MLKLLYSQFTELKAFTQFGSDLDPMTKAKLERGKRTIEVLKQPLHKVISREKQAIILYSLVNGFLDKVEIDKISQYEKDLYNFLDTDLEGQELIKIISDTLNLPEKEKIDKVLERFQKTFI